MLKTQLVWTWVLENSHTLQATWVFTIVTTPLFVLPSNDNLHSRRQKGQMIPAENLKNRTNEEEGSCW